MIASIKEFWVSSYRSDRTAFYFEAISFVFTVAASMTLAVNAAQPDMLTVYSLFTVASVTQCYASWRRRLVWFALMGAYFTLINIYGYGVASAWI